MMPAAVVGTVKLGNRDARCGHLVKKVASPAQNAWNIAQRDRRRPAARPGTEAAKQAKPFAASRGDARRPGGRPHPELVIRSPLLAPLLGTMGKDESPDTRLLVGGAPEAPAVVDTPTFFVTGPRARRDFGWAVAFFGAYALSLILGAVAASKANPAYDVLSSPSALAVRILQRSSHAHPTLGLRLWRPRRSLRVGTQRWRPCKSLRIGHSARAQRYAGESI